MKNEIIPDAVKHCMLPLHFKQYPSQMPFHRIGTDDIIAVDSDGTEHRIVNTDNPSDEFSFISVMKYYGGISGGVGLNKHTYTELFSVSNDRGGYIPVIVFPALKCGAAGDVKINIDGRITEIHIPPNDYYEGRSVLGGFFPIKRRMPTLEELEYSKVCVLDRKVVNIINPTEELEMGNDGIYFERKITVEFRGDCIESNHGSYTCFSLVKFT